MSGDPTSLWEFLKQGGLLALAVLLGWCVKWLLLKLFALQDSRVKALEEDLEKVKAQRDAARQQVLDEKDRYHRLAQGFEPMLREWVRWCEYFATNGNVSGGGSRRGGGRPPPATVRGDPHLEEDPGGPAAEGRKRSG